MRAAARLQEDQSILDGILDQARGLNAKLGVRDRSKLSNYLDNVREVERRIQQAESQHAQDVTLIDKPLGIPDAFGEHTGVIFEIMALAMQADLSRVFTFMMSRESSQRTFPEIDIADPVARRVAPRRSAGKSREKRDDQRPVPEDVREIPRQAAIDPGRRRLAAGSFADVLRQRHGELERPRHRSAAAHRGGRSDRASGIATWHCLNGQRLAICGCRWPTRAGAR